jgi:hypothetical protein
MFRFVCECGRQLQAREDDVGKKARCPSCDKVMTVPSEAIVNRRERRVERIDRRDRDHDRDDHDDDDRDRRSRRDIERPEKNSGKATLAMVLGLLAVGLPLFLGILALVLGAWWAGLLALAPLVLLAIPAVILGTMALRDIGKSKGRVGGKGLAITGIVVSCLGFMLLGPIAIAFALLQPAVTRVQQAATRLKDAENLKALALAIHNFTDAHGKLPQATAFRTRDGRPGLSWRVALLPYLNEDNLYRQFKLDEPWDSPHNLRLVSQMPKVFLMPGQADDGTGRTHYQVFVGKGTLFEDPFQPKQPGAPVPPSVTGPGQIQLGTRFPVGVIDGTSNTILFATARTPVVWTKPDDLGFEANGILPPLGEQTRSDFNVALADASVRSLPQSISEQTLKAMITRNGGEVVPWP